jgi:glycine cleavage system regulatory protein
VWYEALTLKTHLMSGETRSNATATVQLPASCTLDRLRQALEALASDLMVNINVRQ